MKSQGFTLMELLIVLAVLAIIAAILIPRFTNTTDRARLKSDVQSAMVIQNALDLYRIEQGAALNKTTMGEVIKELVDFGYLDDKDIKPQTAGAVWERDPASNLVMVNIQNCGDSGVTRAYSQLTAQEKSHVKP